MYLALAQLTCDSVGCTEHYPVDHLSDCAIDTPSELRRQAHAAGWKRHCYRDYCPEHAAMIDAHDAAKKGVN